MARALIADDDPDVRDVIEQFLTRSGHEVVAAADGTDAIECLTTGTYDVVVLDVEMPRVSGLGVLAASAQLPHPRPPVVMLSGLATTQARRRGLAAGATEYLTKPIARREFMAAIDRVLDSGATTPDRRPPRHLHAEV